MGETTVSVAMATYNGGAYLRDQLESIASQRRPPDELVVSDDGSSDETLTILREFASVATFQVNLFRQPTKLGYPQNFSAALRRCGGDIVFLCDQDDVWLPEKIFRLVDCFNHNPRAVLVMHDLEICRADLSTVGQTKIGRIAKDGDVQREYVTGAAMAIRGGFLNLCLPVPDLPGITHDTWLNRCALAVGGKVVMREALTRFRRHAENASAAMNPANAGRRMSRLDLLLKRFRRPPRFTALHGVPESPWVPWLRSNEQKLQAGGYLDKAQLERLISQEEARTAFMLRRRELLQFPRWRRWFPLWRLYTQGGYGKFCGRKNACKDALVAALPQP
jgi:glycosyltransferase involved in cell wall biosynthesis